MSLLEEEQERANGQGLINIRNYTCKEINLFKISMPWKINALHEHSKKKLKRPRGRAVSASDFGSRGRGFESRWRRDSYRT